MKKKGAVLNGMSCYVDKAMVAWSCPQTLPGASYVTCQQLYVMCWSDSNTTRHVVGLSKHYANKVIALLSMRQHFFFEVHRHHLRHL